jgi:CDP-glucose 4,6-dehydratase
LAQKLRDEPKKWSGSWNFGPETNDVRNVKEVAEVIITHLGMGRIEVEKAADQLHEANLLQLNCDKSHQLLNWYPRWQVDKTLEATALWYKHILDGGDAEQMTRSQIQDFFPELT